MFTIRPITKEQLDALDEKLAGIGTSITIADTGIGGKWVEYVIVNSERGMSAEAIYDRALQSLAVTVAKKPVFITEGMIEAALKDAIYSTKEVRK